MKSLNEIEQEQELEKLLEDGSAWGVPLFMLLSAIPVTLAMSAHDIENWLTSDKAKGIGAKIKKFLGADKKAKSIFKTLMSNKKAMEEIKNAKRGQFRATIQKYVSPEDYKYIVDATRNNIDTGELSNRQVLNRKTSGEFNP